MLSLETIPNRNTLPLSVNVIAAYSSTNTISVSLEGHQVQPTAAEIVVIGKNDAKQPILSFYLKNERTNVLLKPSPEDMALDSTALIEGMIEYAETMGFIISTMKEPGAPVPASSHSDMAIFGGASNAYGAATTTEVIENAETWVDTETAESEEVTTPSTVQDNVDEYGLENWNIWVKYLASF